MPSVKCFRGVKKDHFCQMSLGYVVEKSIGDVSEACGCRVQWMETQLIHREEPVLLEIFIDHLMDGTLKDLTEHRKD